MCNYLRIAFEEAENQNISKSYILELKNILDREEIQWSDLESIELRICNSISNKIPAYYLDESENRFWYYVKREIYQLLSYESDKYKDIKIEVRNFSDKMIPVIISSICSQLGMDKAIFGGVITILLMIPLKIGIEAWCSHYKDEYLNKEQKQEQSGDENNVS